MLTPCPAVTMVVEVRPPAAFTGTSQARRRRRCQSGDLDVVGVVRHALETDRDSAMAGTFREDTILRPVRASIDTVAGLAG